MFFAMIYSENRRTTDVTKPTFYKNMPVQTKLASVATADIIRGAKLE